VVATTLRRPGSDHDLRIGFVPLTDAAPLIVADALGMFAEQGIRVTLVQERAWAAIRDKLCFGALDGAQLLAPTAIALAAGAAGLRRRLTVTAGLARNGNTLVLSHALAAAVGRAAPVPAEAFAAALLARAEEGLPPPTLAVVHPFSSHNYLLRHWLAAGGVDPDLDVRLVVVPPPLVARALAEGAIEAFCAGEPWGSHAIATGAGRLALGSGDIWPDHPEKVLAFAEATEEPRMIAATTAVIEAQRWLEDPANRAAAASLMQERALPDLPLPTIRAALDGVVAAAPGETPQPLAAPIRFDPASRPERVEARAWLAAMRRWGHIDASDEEALSPWRPDLWDVAALRLGLVPGITAVPPSPLLPNPQETDA
jgi:ABC-type nitrate/sulfonate/bicarbonate transport system substrate-binding protein